VRIDQSEPSDRSGDAPVARRAWPTPDEADAASTDRGTALSGDGPPDSSVRPDSGLRTERTVAYRAVVDAAYRQYAIDHSDRQTETPERETAAPAVSRIDVQDLERHRLVPAEHLKGKGQPAEAMCKSLQATDDTNAATGDRSTPADLDGGMRSRTIGHGDHELYAVAARAFSGSPASAPGGDGSIGNGGGRQPPADDTPPGPEGDDPEGVNGGLGQLVSVDAKDRAADLLAERIGGEASVRFANGPANEFDAVSSEYVAQAKPANFTLNQAFRNQAKVTFEVAIQSGRTPYFQFDGPPGPGVLQTLSRYAARYGIEPVIDLTPQGEANA
jgi:Restriction endonuclease fold toxin 3